MVAHGGITNTRNIKLWWSSIYTSDFHSIKTSSRVCGEDTKINIINPVVIKKNVFIGAHTIILKGETIGRNSIIGSR